MSMRTIASAVSLAVLVGACAGRAPQPVPVVQAQDKSMDCAAITAEVQANNDKIASLGKEEGGKVAQNVIVGAAGLFIPLLWFGMDFQNAAGKEVAALQQRQTYLATMSDQRGCATANPQPAPVPPPAKPANGDGWVAPTTPAATSAPTPLATDPMR